MCLLQSLNVLIGLSNLCSGRFDEVSYLLVPGFDDDGSFPVVPVVPVVPVMNELFLIPQLMFVE